MSLFWIKINTTEITKNYSSSFQNISIINDSKVYLTVLDKNLTPTDDSIQITLPAKKIQNVYIPKDTFVWYAIENGGICTYMINEVIQLKNYNISTVHEIVTLDSDKEITVPEGALVTIQNHSTTHDAAVSFNTIGSGSFVLATFQTMSIPCCSETVVKFIGHDNQIVSYLIQQSPSVTQLSDDMSQKIDTMYTDLLYLKNNMIDMTELDALTKEINKLNWSNLFTKNINSPTLEILLDKLIVDPEISSEGIDKHSILTCYINFKLKVDYNGTPTDIDAYMLFDFVKETQNGSGFISNIKVSNDILRDIIDSFKITWDTTDPEISEGFRINIFFKNNVLNDVNNVGIVSYKIYDTNNAYKVDSTGTSFSSQMVLDYNVLMYNEESNSATETDIKSIISDCSVMTPIDDIIVISEPIINMNKSGDGLIYIETASNIIFQTASLNPENTLYGITIIVPVSLNLNVNKLRPTVAYVDYNKNLSTIDYRKILNLILLCDESTFNVSTDDQNHTITLNIYNSRNNYYLFKLVNELNDIIQHTNKILTIKSTANQN